MLEQQYLLANNHRAVYKSHSARWERLCRTYLPYKAKDSIWRYSREESPDDPEQGWKLHVSATVLGACHIMERTGPLLRRRQVLYKAPASLDELDKLNSGLYYGYSQVGKFLTIYPRTDEEAVLLARALHLITRHTPGPAVPFDLRYRPDGCVYYRYGAFKAMEIDGPDGSRIFAMRDPGGRLVPDPRDSNAKPVWAVDPFPPQRAARAHKPSPSPLKTTYKAFRALSQRGKGGVYQALDLSGGEPRLCVLKEGRRDGEVGWDGRDGFWRVRHEARVLDALDKAGAGVPRVYASFEADGNFYLAAEHVEGVNLENWLGRKRRRLALARSLRYSVELATVLARVHAAGWVWRDCKPRNIILTPRGRLRPLDFEGACMVSRPDPVPWGTPCYIPPEWGAKFTGRSRLPEDLYALGSIIYLLLTGCPPEAAPTLTLEKLRRNVPTAARRVVAELLDADPRRRPHAHTVARRLTAVLDGKKT
ncbi:MAG TPA: lipopolysaccharide kinase InaA family protein [Pyrinomonadaceae bacterium]|nr:lipopolysaccharide kinase InaA family protein [Pyrinomonadaceae bacterium]